jgi:hypothetical protein
VGNNPLFPDSYAARVLGISEEALSARRHILKRAAGLGGADDVNIYENGDVIAANGEYIGNILDELY